MCSNEVKTLISDLIIIYSNQLLNDAECSTNLRVLVKAVPH